MDAGKRMPVLKLFLVRQRLQGMHTYLWLCVMFSLVLMSDGSQSKPCEKSCLSGRCVNGSCVCDRGWVGDQCQHCQGRFKWVLNYDYLNLFSPLGGQDQNNTLILFQSGCWGLVYIVLLLDYKDQKRWLVPVQSFLKYVTNCIFIFV